MSRGDTRALQLQNWQRQFEAWQREQQFRFQFPLAFGKNQGAFSVLGFFARHSALLALIVVLATVLIRRARQQSRQSRKQPSRQSVARMPPTLAESKLNDVIRELEDLIDEVGQMSATQAYKTCAADRERVLRDILDERIAVAGLDTDARRTIQSNLQARIGRVLGTKGVHAGILQLPYPAARLLALDRHIRDHLETLAHAPHYCTSPEEVALAVAYVFECREGEAAPADAVDLAYALILSRS